MKTMRSLLCLLLLAGALSWSTAPASAQEGVLLKVEAIPGSNYCHMKFPAIREETLNSDRPELKDADSGDIIDFYGPCDHDPLGKEEVAAQKTQFAREAQGNSGSSQ